MLIASLLKSHRLSGRRSGGRAGRTLKVVTAVSTAMLPALAVAAPWELKNDVELPDVPGAVTQKVELADLDADGFVDIAFANSAGDNIGNQNTAQLNQILMNSGGASFEELGGVFEDPDNAYVIKAADLDNDGDLDLVVGVNFTGGSYVLINEGGNSFTREMLGNGALSIGDLEVGDVDGDGNLDIFAADWGTSQPFGDPDDQGAAMRLWTGNGDGTFNDGSGQLPAGMGALASWVFDIELVDFDNDYDLDAFISSRGFGKALVFRNDGTGTFENYPVPALQPAAGKNVNVAFTPMDLNNDEYLDIITLQDGTGGGACIDIEGVQYCSKRNSVLINDKVGQFTDNPGDFWPIAANPPKLDFDAATLDFDSDGDADVVITGIRQGGVDINSRLLLNNAGKLALAPAPNDAAFPVVPNLGFTFGLQFADFDRDGREDVAVAQRDPELPNFVLFGTDGVAADTQVPRIAPHEVLADSLFFGKDANIRARVHDYKTPTAWHDFQFDEKLGDYNYVEGALTNTNRRLPYMEFALSLAAPEEILTLPDGDPKKKIVPSVWFGESLWRAAFKVPYNGNKEDTLTWQYCAIDAAGNKTCVGPFQVQLSIDPADCGDGTVQEWEACDDGVDDPLCIQCELACGNGTCDEPEETPMNCFEDCGTCDMDGACEPEQGESEETCPEDCTGEGFCGDGMCTGKENAENCPADCGDSESDSTGVCGDGQCDPGEVCPEDCAEPTEGVCGNGVCEVPSEDANNCPEDCVCGDGICAVGEVCPEDCGESASETNGECPDTAGGAGGQCQLDDDGCGCTAETDDTRSLWASLLLFGVFGVRRFRRKDA